MIRGRARQRHRLRPPPLTAKPRAASHGAPRLRSQVAHAVRSLVVGGLFLIALVGCRQGSIVRVRSGYSYQERAIDPRAYTAYIRGRLYEARGDTRRAAEQYNYVILADPDAPEAWVRLGAIHCTADPSSASNAWRKAEQLDPESPQLWLERIRGSRPKWCRACGHSCLSWFKNS